MLPGESPTCRFPMPYVLVLLLLFGAQGGEKPHRQVIVWGKNTPEWNRQLGVTGARTGCSDTPPSCIARANSFASEGVQVFLAVPLRKDTLAYSAEYVKLSSTAPSLVEIGIDDFADQYRKLIASDADAPALLNAFIDAVEREGGQLKFGATIYEDDLDSPELSDAKLPVSIRRKFDFVHLYLHYRSDAARMPEYFRRAVTLFPGAKIFLGVYAYDRISYIPCAKGDSRPCTQAEEMKYLGEALDADLALLKEDAAGLEFYPGSFGIEQEWTGWERPNVCPGRKQECLENTKALRLLVLEKLQGAHIAGK